MFIDVLLRDHRDQATYPGSANCKYSGDVSFRSIAFRSIRHDGFLFGRAGVEKWRSGEGIKLLGDLRCLAMGS